jgi:hypothetical protein
MPSTGASGASRWGEGVTKDGMMQGQVTAFDAAVKLSGIRGQVT